MSNKDRPNDPRPDLDPTFEHVYLHLENISSKNTSDQWQIYEWIEGGANFLHLTKIKLNNIIHYVSEKQEYMQKKKFWSTRTLISPKWYVNFFYDETIHVISINIHINFINKQT